MARRGTVQETLYLTPEAIAAWEIVQKLPQNRGKSKSEIIRRLILKEIDPNTISFAPDDVTLARLVRLRDYYQEREGQGLIVDNAYVTAQIAQEKDQEIADGKNNRVRMKYMHESFIEMKEQFIRLLEILEKENSEK